MSNLSLTLQDCKALFECYEKMADAARENDWQTLIRHGEQATRIRETAEKRRPVLVMSAAEQKEIAELIRRIQFLDGEVRSHAMPMLDSTRKLLSGAVRNRAVHSAYGAHGP